MAGCMILLDPISDPVEVIAAAYLRVHDGNLKPRPMPTENPARPAPDLKLNAFLRLNVPRNPEQDLFLRLLVRLDERAIVRQLSRSGKAI